MIAKAPSKTIQHYSFGPVGLPKQVCLRGYGQPAGDGDQRRSRVSYLDDWGVKILQSCNGLLLCSSTVLPYRNGNNHSFKFYICNPTTKYLAPLSFPSREFEASLVAVNLAYDPLRSPHYKLLCIRMMDEPSSTYRMNICSSETYSMNVPTAPLNSLHHFV
ncbi:hypothetical protein L1049_014750 [Liquidambar formosana]|uniref:Uncharacterized protein n=1 Tax=Liquidambar formosana TaxID=63359 RepID=A0AAP0RWY0_LIQFO